MSLVDDLIRRTKLNSQSTEDWIKLYNEVQAFFDGDYPEADKERLRKEGYLESLAMMANWLGCF